MHKWVQTSVGFYREHGTKIIGSVTAGLATTQAVLAYLSSNPDIHFLLPHKYLAMLSTVNGLLGIMTIRRGFTNSRNSQ